LTDTTTLWYIPSRPFCQSIRIQRSWTSSIHFVLTTSSFTMQGKGFCSIRKNLGKTQRQMSELLGISLKAVQSFEQGWRSIPAYVERLALFLLAMKRGTHERLTPCWEIRRCPPRVREMCPAWEFRSGHLCWFINGTICQGKPRVSWNQKMLLCKKCEVFTTFTKHWGLASGHKRLR
jgi:DNA-binding transcriptional regulator YiaG